MSRSDVIALLLDEVSLLQHVVICVVLYYSMFPDCINISSAEISFLRLFC